MNLNDPIIQLCIKGSEAEFKRDIPLSKQLYKQAWEESVSNYQKCIAAHYMARNLDDYKEQLQWNEKSLEYAKKCDSHEVENFMPSLYINLADSYKKLGNLKESKKFQKLVTKP